MKANSMRDHTFPIGLSVRLKDRTYISPGAAETYRITAKLPWTSNWPQYRIRNDELGQERVSGEDNLEPIEWGMASPH
ncbi:Hypothetical protein SM11_pC0551 (plasmid) [Sinorhizobium meliloti SM11]|uniref:Uncharacterized protein n=2 Tax=Rhizobium meliloti TaxID=382 RepID=Q92Y33_RHIME|nr:Hypothetical protein SMa1919 [Sinorhizobium meliloti 1021]AEH81624.1 Hypothetical protein SM11_pC0551 [Sinorhizobium meliloti SM11]AGG70749.1 Hypothetical protein SM2011_a1919 [Sinorhizobium meliloti 2011]ATA95768.1 hypothetical protein BWO76_05080 [Sinorhizobium meliloti]ATB01455.1 hypothetical protein BWO90_04940 [Sinorhizobium meliloti]